MKHIFTITLILFFGLSMKAQCPWNFTVSSTSGNFSLTCSSPTLSVFAIHSSTNVVNYQWSGPSFTSTQAVVSLTANGIYSVVATNAVSSCSLMQTFTVTTNTVSPTNSVSPTSQAITCNSGAPVTFSGTILSPSLNILNEWYSPLNPLPNGVPIISSSNTLSILSGTYSPGVYTMVTTDNANGCKTQKTITVTSLSAWPTFSVFSSTNFSIGCNGQTTLCIINPVSTQTPPATCSYTFLAPTFSGVLTQSIILGFNTCKVTSIPGTWTVVVQDNANFCRTTISVPITQNTVMPSFTLQGIPPTTSMSCNGTVSIFPPVLPNFTVSATSGTVSSNNVTNLCNGFVKICLTNTLTTCKLCDSLSFAGPTSIRELDDSEIGFSIYPNPTNSSFFIKHSGMNTAEVKIFNGEGKLIEEMKFEKEAEIKNLSNGFYFIELKIEGSTIRKKVLVIR